MRHRIKGTAMRAKEGAAFRDRSYVRHIDLHPAGEQPKIGEDQDAKAPQPAASRGKLGARTILLAALYLRTFDRLHRLV